jgi:glycosyltransferase involved in cell wall biosynthesis
VIKDDLKMNLSVVIPVLNDQEGLRVLFPELQRELRSMNASFEILVVDDGSHPPVQPTDCPGDQVRILRHRRNKGYGRALKSGLQAARGEYVVFIDADGQHDPSDIPRFYEAVKDYDLVTGVRANANASPLWRRPGKWLLTRLVNTFSPHRVVDINCGFRCARREPLVQHMHLFSDRFSFSISSLMILLSRHYDVGFLNIQARKRLNSSSSVRISTGFETAMLIIRMIVLTHPLRFFLPISAVFFVMGSLWTIPYAWKGRGISVGGLFLLMAAVLTFFFGVLSDQLALMAKKGVVEE